MPFVICKDCKKPAEVKRFARGAGYLTKSYPGGCDCGTDQRRGKARQTYIVENMADTIEELAILVPEPVKAEPKPVEPEPKPPKAKPDEDDLDPKGPDFPYVWLFGGAGVLFTILKLIKG